MRRVDELPLPKVRQLDATRLIDIMADYESSDYEPADYYTEINAVPLRILAPTR